jgi:hypothetical protein
MMYPNLRTFSTVSVGNFSVPSSISINSSALALMVYDVWGSWSPTVGPNAPLNDSCAPTADRDGSAVSAVNAWTSANFPANQESSLFFWGASKPY